MSCSPKSESEYTKIDEDIYGGVVDGDSKLSEIKLNSKTSTQVLTSPMAKLYEIELINMINKQSNVNPKFKKDSMSREINKFEKTDQK